MGDPKLHHYVPQFYLRRFTDPSGRFWVWDRDSDRVFRTQPRAVAAESNFYLLPELAEHGYDPVELERQFADLEGQVSAITEQWLDWIRHGKPGDSLPVPGVNREIVSLFLALQSLRTADARSILVAFSALHGYHASSDEEIRSLHAAVLWDDDLISWFAGRMSRCAWLFAVNETSAPFVTSDNPLAFRTSDNRMWVKPGNLSEDAYAVYPLASDVIMYCYPDEGVWADANLARFDCRISPVTLTGRMIQDENSAQVFMASRFVISSRNSFSFERDFAKNLGLTGTRRRSRNDS
ncbi:DUF4238 domain-containing protein [Streptomyces sp. NBC_00704]|uniref:DUF4238 domain-containing protein n=1 Tax=Streptomyces sp. NBC_00704 TaxID=2975809 RepID=UPI002E371A97|nr:DUF4238 domain-containing protein [Streptomyces sp. NBC_00704]